MGKSQPLYIRLFTTKADTKKRNRTDRQRTEFTI